MFRCGLRRSNWYFTQEDKRAGMKLSSHLLMDGGELSVDVRENSKFLRLCAEAIVSKEEIFVVEKRSPQTFRVFFDFDTHLETPLAEEDLREWYVKLCKFVCGTLNELFSDANVGFRLVCAVAAPKSAHKMRTDCHKYGVHIVVPEIIVTEPMMLRIRSAVIQKLENNFEKGGPTTWADDVDLAVYTSSGFRMLYSHKSARCKCTVKDRDNCVKCGGVGKISEARPYHPEFIMSSAFDVEEVPKADEVQSVLSMLEMTSIRCGNAEPSVAFNKAPPSWFEDACVPCDDQDDGPWRPTKRPRMEGHQAVENGLKGKEDLSTTDLQELNRWFQMMCQKRELPKEYKKADIRSAFSYTLNGVRSHVIARVDSQYCMNIGRCHSTNTVYILVNLLTKRAYMKCYCRCDTTEGRRTRVRGMLQMCKDFTSSPIDCAGLTLSIVCGQPSIPARVLAMF